MSSEREPIKKYKFRLTTPPSVNTTYKAGYNPKTHKPVFYMDKKAHVAKNILIKEIMAYASINKCPKFKETVVIAELIVVNWRKGRDINNIHKILWDAFEAAEIVDNDANVIERPLYKEYNDEKASYIEVYLYEAKGSPSIEDIRKYFFWHNDEANILEKMIKKISIKRNKLK